jgi:hypothetical protein
MQDTASTSWVIRRRLRTMCVAGCIALATAAQARVSVSVEVSQPGAYGRVNIGGAGASRVSAPAGRDRGLAVACGGTCLSVGAGGASSGLAPALRPLRGL